MLGKRLHDVFASEAMKSEDINTIPLHFVFSVGDQDHRSLEVVEFDRSTESKAKKAGHSRISDDGRDLQRIIQLEMPDLVVFDTLIRVHALDENNNVAMSHLLKFLRDICSIDEEVPVATQAAAVAPPSGTDAGKKGLARKLHRKKLAHVLIHHTRKESSRRPCGSTRA